MASSRSVRWYAQLQKELREYRVSMVWAPLVIAGALSALVLVSVLLGGRIAAFGDGLIDRILAGGGEVQPSIVIQIEHDDEADVPSQVSASGAGEDLQVAPLERELPDSAWNFSREWRFEPERSEERDYEVEQKGSLNPLLGIPHLLLLMVLVLVTANYLLGALYTDRRDRSVLFWKSMPVSSTEEVLVKMAVAMLVLPAIYIAISIVLQLVLVLLSMLLLWRLGLDPWGQILDNLHFTSLFARQLGGWVFTALWIAPVYAWLLLASSWARRSPFLVAVAPVLGLVFAEMLVFGSSRVADAVRNHLPPFVGGEEHSANILQAGFWAGHDWVGLLSGLLFAALALLGASYLRRNRFET